MVFEHLTFCLLGEGKIGSVSYKFSGVETVFSDHGRVTTPEAE
jgi:hypothetical protein